MKKSKMSFSKFFVNAKNIAFASLASALFLLSSCRDSSSYVQPTSPSFAIKNARLATAAVTVATTDTVFNVSFQNAKGLTLTAKLYVPALQPGEQVPAMVVMHGCGGMWSNDNVAANKMKTNFNEWAADFTSKKIVSLFIDSYTNRLENGQPIVEFCGRTPLNDSICSPAYERTYDAYAGLAYLRTLPYIQGNRIGLMGFSHGGSTTMAALVNTTLVTKSQWTVWYQSKTYNVSAPVARPAQGGFKTAVAYYPGGGFYSYFGSVSDATKGKYINYAPLLILIGNNDDLLPATQVQYDRAKLNGAGTSIEMVIYNNTNHSFDEKNTGDDAVAKAAARTKVASWLAATL